MKGCGKSAPRSWQQERHGKPHREQDRIGTARRPQKPPVSFPDEPSGLVARGAWRQAHEMNGHRRAPMQSAVQNPAYRLGDMSMAGAWKGLHAPVSNSPIVEKKRTEAWERVATRRPFVDGVTRRPRRLSAIFCRCDLGRGCAQPRSGEVEAIGVHHLVPGRHEVGHELLLRVRHFAFHWKAGLFSSSHSYLNRMSKKWLLHFVGVCVQVTSGPPVMASAPRPVPCLLFQPRP